MHPQVQNFDKGAIFKLRSCQWQPHLDFTCAGFDVDTHVLMSANRRFYVPCMYRAYMSIIDTDQAAYSSLPYSMTVYPSLSCLLEQLQQ